MEKGAVEGATAKKTAGKRRGVSDDVLKRLLLVPAMAILFCFAIYPFIWTLRLSFYEYSVLKADPPVFVGTRNYSQIFSDPEVWQRFVFTARYVILAVSIQFFIGFGLALLLNRRFKAKGFVTVLLMLPMMLSPAVVGLIWKFMFEANWGIINYYLGLLLGIPKIPWLTQINTALWATVIVDTWMWSPFMMLLSLAGLSAIPEYLYEAAEVDRASGWFKFRHITLPLVAPLLVIALLFRIMDSFKMIDLVWTLTGGAPGSTTETVSLYLYRAAFGRFQTGQACAIAIVLLVLIIALSNMFIRYLTRLRTA